MMTILRCLGRKLLKNYNNPSILFIYIYNIIIQSILVFGSGMNGVEFLKHFSLLGAAT